MIDEKVEITPATLGITEADGKGATWHADIWNLTVPFNQKYMVGPGSTLGCYLVGDDAAEMPDKTQIRVVKRDTMQEEALVLLDALYAMTKEFTDINKIVRLQVKRETTILPGEHLAILVNGTDLAGTGDCDASASRFKLTAIRSRKPLSM